MINTVNCQCCNYTCSLCWSRSTAAALDQQQQQQNGQTSSSCKSKKSRYVLVADLLPGWIV